MSTQYQRPQSISQSESTCNGNATARVLGDSGSRDSERQARRGYNPPAFARQQTPKYHTSRTAIGRGCTDYVYRRYTKPTRHCTRYTASRPALTGPGLDTVLCTTAVCVIGCLRSNSCRNWCSAVKQCDGRAELGIQLASFGVSASVIMPNESCTVVQHQTSLDAADTVLIALRVHPRYSSLKLHLGECLPVEQAACHEGGVREGPLPPRDHIRPALAHCCML
jgi:hypothetical protein